MLDIYIPENKEKLSHMPRATALKQIYEWAKTGHINNQQFSGLITSVMATTREDVDKFCSENWLEVKTER